MTQRLKTGTTTEPMQDDLRLSKNQRNLYYYYLYHRKKYKNNPCFVPKNPIRKPSNRAETKDESYIRVIDSLERMNLFRVDRSGSSYMEWKLLPVSPNKNYKKEGA